MSAIHSWNPAWAANLHPYIINPDSEAQKEGCVQINKFGVYLIQTDILPPQPLQPLVWKLLNFPGCIHQLR